jgi:hypothetical protein
MIRIAAEYDQIANLVGQPRSTASELPWRGTAVTMLRTQREQEIIEGRAHSIDWDKDDYAVVDGNSRIGRMYKTRVPAGEKWLWFLQVLGTPNSGSADTLAGAHAAIDAAYGRLLESMKVRA